MSKKDDYILLKFIEIRFADPISSIKLINDLVVTGTMMGRINLYIISEKKAMVLSELNSENISDIAYNEKEKAIYVGIGDEEIKVYEIAQNSFDTIPHSQSINVYDSDLQHTNNCENAFILLSPESIFRIQLPQIDEGTLKIVQLDSQYDLKYFDEDKILDKREYKTSLPTTNYTVPFDFDGKRFLWVEFLSAKNRQICVANIPSPYSEKPYKYFLDKSIGHICQAKLLPNNRVFIVHSLKKCEIRLLDEKFTLLESFEHIGEEVIAIDIIINQESKTIIQKENIIFNKNNITEQINNQEFEEIKENKNHKEEEINTKRVMETSGNKKDKENDNNNEFLYINQNTKKEKIIDIKEICVITLDIDGNVNLFKNKKENTLFNLYEISSISKDQKDKHFFSMGYAYYIKSNLKYFCITSDHGYYIIQSNN
jgi:hypothetical protein